MSIPEYGTPPPWGETGTSVQESDPYGKDANAPGSKLDLGKDQMELTERGFAKALREVARIGTYGAVKYTPDGWQEVPEGIRRYRNAASRHRNDFYQGETYDPESGYHHLAHECWNRLAELELLLRMRDGS